jgi:hypothetical protein
MHDVALLGNFKNGIMIHKRFRKTDLVGRYVFKFSIVIFTKLLLSDMSYLIFWLAGWYLTDHEE